MLKVGIHIKDADGATLRVCWYVGTSDAMIEKTIRMLFRLPRDAQFLLRDADGDLVPVSSTLPHEHVFALVLMSSPESMSTAIPMAMDPAGGLMQEAAGSGNRRAHKRRRPLHSPVDGAATHLYHTNTEALMTAVPSRPVDRAPSITHLITQFVETFTRAIPNDDNINFIPNTGPFALYSLYCSLIPQETHHPKSQNAFYKITSTHGRVERQRVIRYYQFAQSIADGADVQCAMYKPEGKGPLLRRYVQVNHDLSTDELVRAATFVTLLDLDPSHVVSQYQAFVRDFLPISKAVFQVRHQ
ncbi:hypothetical protein Poli38472_012761 [Pythium oligandrum]|uniref:PB1 domain-containing protein n=1 Tax=Pythium oligandrum TaxID=41045 RepID=A0A8K1CE81_PYTOL|nr:hypothetical protein Poli38472_012761 [Pythium oligandrum]|eukprot:TMW61570.1 hypothetical protein Poli38472_012761 [Pythium oligandrum]